LAKLHFSSACIMMQMAPLQYFAGFGPKDLMEFLYLPAYGILLLVSLVLLSIKRRGRPYPLAILVFPLAGLGWYLYDKLSTKQVDRSQALVLLGIVTVTAILAIASTSLVPEQDSIINLMALLATVCSLCFSVAAIIQRNK
jgi:uncharacterized membrane protein